MKPKKDSWSSVHSFGRICTSIYDSRSLGSRCIRGTDESTLDMDSSFLWCTMMRVILNHKSWSGSATKNAFYLKASSVGNLLHPNKFLSQQLWYKRAFTFQKEFIYNLFLGIHWQQCFSFAYTRHLQSAARNQKERRSPLLVGNLNLKRNEKNFVYIKSCPKWERLCHVQKRL